MDEYSENSVVKRCIVGPQAEFARNLEKNHALYQAVWKAASTDFEACLTAHYVARFQDDPLEKLRWNQITLEKANSVADDSV